ncbi:hypothetical protein SBA7_110009 [Candidatus Sulfotelmatobacter sp. SbA7]|nr:hypothetical protein SBA7_110009 [Candidatus Sulfotelmatobacter sp. SbA7]
MSFINPFTVGRRGPPGLKPAFFLVPNGTAEQAAEKVAEGARSSPRALKRDAMSATYGTTEVVPFPRPCLKWSFSAACEAVPYPGPIHADCLERRLRQSIFRHFHSLPRRHMLA